jgi:hypothetical protein
MSCGFPEAGTPSIPTPPLQATVCTLITVTQLNHGDPSEGMDDRGRRSPSELFVFFRCTDTKPGVGCELSMTTNPESRMELDDSHSSNIL